MSGELPPVDIYEARRQARSRAEYLETLIRRMQRGEQLSDYTLTWMAIEVGLIPPKTMPSRKDMRSDLMVGLGIIIGRGEQLPAPLTEKLGQYRNALVNNDKQVTEIALSALYVVYNSKGELTDDNLVDRVLEDTGAPLVVIDRVADRLYEQNYLLSSDMPDRATVFGVPGLWLLENASACIEESIDAVAITERNLRQAGFFEEVSS